MLVFNFIKSKHKKLVLELINKRDLLRYIRKCCGNRTVYICYNFLSSKDQIKMNRDFKNHNYNTDILTFDVSNNDCELTGDVYISLKQVRKNAKRYQVSLKDEINRVLIHGFLHLSGYNDETKNEKKEMRKQEEKFLNYLKKRRSTRNMCDNHY